MLLLVDELESWMKTSAFETIESQAARIANLVASAVHAYDAAGEEITETVLAAAGVKQLTRGQRTILKNYWELDDFVRHQARRGLKRHEDGRPISKIKKTLTGHENKLIKNDGYSSLVVISRDMLGFLVKHKNKSNPFRPNQEKGNGNRPYHQDHMIFGSYVCEKIPMLLIDGTWTEDQAATPGEGIRFLVRSFVFAIMTREENNRLDSKGSDGLNLRSAFPDGKHGKLTARAEARNISLCTFDIETLKKYGWTPFCDINAMEKITIKMLRAESYLDSIILS